MTVLAFRSLDPFSSFLTCGYDGTAATKYEPYRQVRTGDFWMIFELTSGIIAFPLEQCTRSGKRPFVLHASVKTHILLPIVLWPRTELGTLWPIDISSLWTDLLAIVQRIINPYLFLVTYYTTFPHDSRINKAIVCIVFLLETVQSACLTNDMYHAFVLNPGDVELLESIGLIWLAVPVLGGIGENLSF